MRKSNRTGLAMVMLASALSGCVGAIDRADFDQEIRSRGGGLSDDFVTEALEVVAAEIGAESVNEVQVITLSIEPPRRVVVAQARRADRSEFVDVITVRDGALLASEPVQDADRLPLDDLTVAIGSLPLRDTEQLGDRALAEFAEVGAFVTAIRVSIDSGTHVVGVEVESTRRTATYRYGLDGESLGEQR